MKVLWLTSWYPNKSDKLEGDFIQRHADAVALFTCLHVIHVEVVQANKIKTSKDQTTNSKNNLTEHIILIRASRFPYPFNKIVDYFRYVNTYKSAIKQYMKTEGKPDLVHVHVSIKAGILALWMKKRYRIPYIVTEHWTIFDSNSPENIWQKNFLFRNLAKKIFKQAALLLTVSDHLGLSIQNSICAVPFKTVYNVVNHAIFYAPTELQKNSKPVFLHISTLSSQKNPEQMLEAFALLLQKFHKEFELWIVGPCKDHLHHLAEKLEIKNRITWYDETSQQNLAGLMRKADALVLYSKFETFGCVNIEAMACGLPVIVSDIPVFREYLQEGFTAYFAPGEKPGCLASVIYSFMQTSRTSPREISQAAEKFHYRNIGKEIEAIYHDVFSKISETRER